MDTGFIRLLPGCHVDVVEDFEVVGEELDGDDEGAAMAGLAEGGKEFLYVGTEPFLGGVACALVGELPLVR